MRELWSTGWDAYCTLGRGWEGSAPPGASSFGLSPFPPPHQLCLPSAPRPLHLCPLPVVHVLAEPQGRHLHLSLSADQAVSSGQVLVHEAVVGQVLHSQGHLGTQSHLERERGLSEHIRTGVLADRP